MERMTIPLPDDFHVHFRRGKILEAVVPHTARYFGRALIMPNTSPNPILTAEDAIDYRNEIIRCSKAVSDSFNPLMTIQITDSTTPKIVLEAKRTGFVFAGKVYPKGVTTNSHNGLTSFEKAYPVFAEMQKIGMVLSLHGQLPQSFCLDREKDFLTTLQRIAKDFPGLKIVMEHISTKESVETIMYSPENVAATITAHHLILTLHDVLSSVGEDGSEGLNPHHYCQPILQRPEDCEALIKAVLSGNPKFFFGSDSAPHVRERKESSCGCAGIFTAPVLPSLIASFIEKYDSLDKCIKFISESGSFFYGLPIHESGIFLIKKPWVVPKEYDGIVPFCAGKTLDWQVE